MNHQALWDKLAAAGVLAQGHAAEPPAPRLHSPWYIRLMLGFAGWIAALFLLSFIAVGLTWVVENEAASMAVGVLLMAAAWWVFRKEEQGEFIEQFALAFSFAGQGLFVFALFKLIEPADAKSVAWLLTALFQAVLALVMSNAIHRGWSGFAAIASLYLAVNDTVLEPMLSGTVLALASLLWLNEFRRADLGAMLRPVAYGVVAALVVMDLASGLFRGTIGFSAGAATVSQWAWMGQLLSGAVLIGVVSVLLHRQGRGFTDRSSLVILAGAVALVLASLEAPGIAIGTCILLLGFAHGNFLLTGFGVLALLVYAGGYYYRLDATLLEKSISLLVTGIVLLVVRWGVLRRV